MSGHGLSVVTPNCLLWGPVLMDCAMFQKLHVAVVQRLTLKKRRDDRVGASLPFHTDWCSIAATASSPGDVQQGQRARCLH